MNELIAIIEEVNETKVAVFRAPSDDVVAICRKREDDPSTDEAFVEASLPTAEARYAEYKELNEATLAVEDDELFEKLVDSMDPRRAAALRDARKKR